MRIGAFCVLAAVAFTALAQPPTDSCDACGVVVSIVKSTERTQWTPLGSATPSIVTASGAPTGAVTQLSIGPKFQNLPICHWWIQFEMQRCRTASGSERMRALNRSHQKMVLRLIAV